MNGKNFALTLMAIGCLMIFSGCVSSFIIGLKVDRSNVMARMIDVSNTFEEFTTEVSIYEEQRDLLYSELLGNMYYSTIFSFDMSIKNKLSNYEAIVDEIDKKRIQLDALCDETYYPDGNINSKCMNYKSIFEQVNNYFVSDISAYNKTVEEYNLYTISLGSTDLIAKYKMTRDYIDFNNDKKYDGRDVE